MQAATPNQAATSKGAVLTVGQQGLFLQLQVVMGTPLGCSKPGRLHPVPSALLFLKDSSTF